MIKINSTGIYYEHLDPSGQFIKRVDLMEESLTPYLDDLVDIESGTTIEELLLSLIHHQDDISLDFASSLNGLSFDVIMEELLIDGEKSKSYVYAEIIHSAQIVNGIWGEGSGITALGYTEDNVLTNFSLEFSPLYAYKHLYIKANYTFDILDEHHNIITSSHREFSLYEIIATILFELTIHGDPNQRKEALGRFIKNINGSIIDEINNEDDDEEPQEFITDIVPLLGDSKPSLEKLLKALDLALEREDYEYATTLRDMIETMRNKNNGKS